MKNLIVWVLGVFLMAGVSEGANFYSLSAEDLDGKKVSLAKYQGKVALIVNTASQCGFTPQYADLESVYKKYQGKNFVILGFPSNDFGAQEPGSNAEIKKFCESKFRVTFPMFSKNSVKGDGKQGVYKFLTEQTPKEFQGEIQWNFEKFLVDKKGNVVARFPSGTSPTSSEVIKKIESLL